MAFVCEKLNSWETVGLEIGSHLELSETQWRCRPYQGLGHALFDVLEGLKSFWPVKKTVAFIPFGGPFLGEAMQGLARQGYHLHKIIPPNGSFPGENERDQLPQETLALFYFRDHALTGEDIVTEKWAELLNDKRILHVEIIFNGGESPPPPHPYGAQIRVLDAHKAVALFGHRFRLHWGSAKLMNWEQGVWGPALKKYGREHSPNKVAIEEFEQELKSFSSDWKQSQGLEVYSPAKGQKKHDRSVFFLKGVNGDFFIESLLEKIDEASQAPGGFESRCETTHLSRWGGLTPWTWWSDAGLSEEQQRSLVVLSSSLIQKKSMAQKVKEVYLDCWKASTKNWD